MFMIASYFTIQFAGQCALGLFLHKSPDLRFIDAMFLLLIGFQILIISVMHAPKDKSVLQAFTVVFSLFVIPFAIYAIMVFTSNPETANFFGISPRIDNWLHVAKFLIFAYLYNHNFLYARAYFLPGQASSHKASEEWTNRMFRYPNGIKPYNDGRGIPIDME
jgi:Mn2+/Fe2+ NRAMP family transporter